VLPDSPAGKTEQIFTGDMLLEVGGVQLVGVHQVRTLKTWMKATTVPVFFLKKV
jgi:hypothetical protein